MTGKPVNAITSGPHTAIRNETEAVSVTSRHLLGCIGLLVKA